MAENALLDRKSKQSEESTEIDDVVHDFSHNL